MIMQSRRNVERLSRSGKISEGKNAISAAQCGLRNINKCSFVRERGLSGARRRSRRACDILNDGHCCAGDLEFSQVERVC